MLGSVVQLKFSIFNGNKLPAIDLSIFNKNILCTLDICPGRIIIV